MVLITDVNYIRVILAVHLLSNFSGLTTVLISQEEIQNWHVYSMKSVFVFFNTNLIVFK